jgi:hypothetical protein
MTFFASSTIRLQVLPNFFFFAFILATVLSPVTVLNKIFFVILIIWTLVILLDKCKPPMRLHFSTFYVILFLLWLCC